MTSTRNDYLIGSRPIEHGSCTQGASGSWYPNFGQRVEMFGWEHEHAPVERTPVEVVEHVASGRPMHVLTDAELRLADGLLVGDCSWDERAFWDEEVSS